MIEVITGCMFSGKTEELIRRLGRAVIAKQKVIIFKPKIDHRSFNCIKDRNDKSIEAMELSVHEYFEIIDAEADVIAIDEAQLFTVDIVPYLLAANKKRKRIIVAGLDLNFRVEPFGPMPQILAIADQITKLQAVCMRCHGTATRTKRLVSDNSDILIGSNEYEARCVQCFDK